LGAVDFFGPVPTELFEGFEDREAGFFDASGNGALAALVDLALDQVFQVVDAPPGPWPSNILS